MPEEEKDTAAGPGPEPQPSVANPEPTAPQRRTIAERHAPMVRLIDRFQLAIDGLRDMIDDFVPIIEERESQRLGPEAMSELRSLDPAQRAKLNDALTRFVESRTSETSEIADQDELIRDAAGDEFKAIFEIFRDDTHSVISFADRLRKGTFGPDRVTIVQNSILAQAVAALEVLVAGTVVQHYVQHPSAMDSERPQFSLADLREFGDVEDAVDALIAKHVSGVMYGSLDDWSAWLEKNCNLKLPSMVADWEVIREAFQRRHIVIHNAGFVSRQYIAHVRHAGEPPKVGDRLPVASSYLHIVLDNIGVLGTSLGALAWGSWHKDERAMSASLVVQRTYELLLGERWSAVEQLAKLGDRMTCPAANSAALRCNGWCAASELRGPEAIRDEIEQWDTSMAQGRFTLVKLVLLGQLDEAAELAPRLLASRELDRGALLEWPVLRRLREHGGFDRIIEAASGHQD